MAVWSASPRLFWGLVAVFGLSAAWIALSSRYPMAFDEAYHIGLIREHAQHWLPFLPPQSTALDMYGSVDRNPSYLYHYLMSFPWRIVTAATSNFAAQVLVLRLLSVGLAVAALVVWRRLLLAVHPSRSLANAVIALVAFTPIVPQVAAQINYDNLLFLGSGVFLLLAVRVWQRLRGGELDVPRTMALLSVGMLSSLVKYPFIPVAVAVVLCLGVLAFRQQRARPRKWRAAAESSFRALGRPTRYALVALLVVATLLCLERFGLNLVRYGTPVPECNQIIGVERCMAYSPWARNYTLTAQKVAWFHVDTAGYVSFWVKRMTYNLLFVLSGPDLGYTGGAPLFVPKVAFVLLCSLGAACMILSFRQLIRKPFAPVLLGASAAYIAALFLQNFVEYVHIGMPVAVQGRYLLPVLPLLYMVALWAISLVPSPRLPGLHRAIVAVLVCGFMTGGGLMTFLVRTDSRWYWPNPTVITINQRAADVARAITPAKQITELETYTWTPYW